MRLVLLMSRNSPWARAVAIHLSQNGHTVHIVDFDKTLPQVDYFSGRNHVQSDEISALHERVEGVHVIKSVFSSNFRYLSSIPNLRRFLSFCDADAVLAMHGGGLGTMAYLSGFDPYAVYAVGSDILSANGIRQKSRAATTFPPPMATYFSPTPVFT